MPRRQNALPHEWLIADERTGEQLIGIVRRLPRGTGVLLLHHGLPPGSRERLRRILARLARSRGLLLLDEAKGEAVRVHDLSELARAKVRRARLLLISPLFSTRSHPGWPPLQRMRASALVRLAHVPVLALGGMNEDRFRRIEPLGFHGWAAIDAWMEND